VGEDGFRSIQGGAEGAKEDLEGWRSFLKRLTGDRSGRTIPWSELSARSAGERGLWACFPGETRTKTRQGSRRPTLWAAARDLISDPVRLLTDVTFGAREGAGG